MTDGEIVNPDKPESLMYASDGTLEGAMFLMEDVASHGPLVGGCLTTWHIHDNLCYTSSPIPDGTVNGLSDLTGCGGDSMVRVTPEMLHVWVLPERQDNPFEGIET
ncbi:MAG: hypothetical protein U5R31_00305 [Acidimicrobiia bacterium]|nr:hypothetical protein [Acidimicrobiia bacterium]